MTAIRFALACLFEFRLLCSRISSQIASWLRAASHRRRLESEMEAELADHLARLTEDFICAGQSQQEAARNARLVLGFPTAHKGEMRASLGLGLWDDLLADIRYGARLLARSPGFTAVAVTSLALAIGANTTIFSLARQVLLQRLAVPQPSQLRLLAWEGDDHVAIHNTWGEGDDLPASGIQSTSFSYPVYRALQASASAAGFPVAAFKDDHMNATIAGHARAIQAELVSGNFYSLASVRPRIGRAILPSDDAVPGSGAVALLSDGLWAQAFGRSPSVLGKNIRVNQVDVTIIGVNPQGFTGAKSVQQSPDIFLPLSLQPAVDPKGKRSLLENSEEWWLNLVGRVAPSVSDIRIQATLEPVLKAAVRSTLTVKAGESLPRIILMDGSRGMHQTDRLFRRPIYVLLTMTGLVLLLACANIANLMLARGARRQREMSVRLALGAGSRRILRQMLTESLMIALLGGMGGLFLGYLGRNTIPRLLSDPWEATSLNIAFDWQIFGFATIITLGTGLLFGMAPALVAARSNVGTALKDGSQSFTRRRKGVAGKSLVGFQVALSTLLVVGAMLFLRTLLSLSQVDVGFPAKHLLLVNLFPPATRYPAGQDIQLYNRLEKAFSAVPGIQSVSASDPPLISGNMSFLTFVVEGQKARDEHHSMERLLLVGQSFFSTMGIPIQQGRTFKSSDTSTSPKVAIINEALARSRFPGINPVGKRFSTSDGTGVSYIEVVGVCADTRYATLRDPATPIFFLPYIQQEQVNGLTFGLRTSRSPADLYPELRRVVAAIDPDLPLVDLRTQQQQIDANMQMERTFAALTSGFGILALALASVGIYGVMAFSVQNRTNEIGIRLALGAQPRQVLTMVLSEATSISLAGILLGTTAAVILARLVESFLYGLNHFDSVSLFGGAALLVAVALAASWIPAHRAATIQPVEALRHE